MSETNFRDMKIEDLQKEILSLAKEKFNLRMQLATDQLKGTHVMKTAKKKLARAKTILAEKIKAEQDQTS